MNSVDLGYAMDQLRRALTCSRQDTALDCVQRALDALERCEVSQDALSTLDACSDELECVMALDAHGEPIPFDEWPGM